MAGIGYSWGVFIENDEIKQAYENFMEFLSLEKCDRTTDFKEIYLNDKVALFLLYKDNRYWMCKL